MFVCMLQHLKTNMRIIIYITSLMVSALVYFLFAAYMSVSAGLSSLLPLISFYSSIIIFGFLSWFHFFYPKTGAILLTIFLLLMFLTWPAFLLIEHFNGEYKPSLLESLLPLALIIVSISLVWLSDKRKEKIKPWIKYTFAIPPALMAIYVGFYFTIRYFG